jgi:hypothetical protein
VLPAATVAPVTDMPFSPLTPAPMRWVQHGLFVRAFSEADHMTTHLGQAVGYTDQPTLLIRPPAGGPVVSWVAGLCEPVDAAQVPGAHQRPTADPDDDRDVVQPSDGELAAWEKVNAWLAWCGRVDAEIRCRDGHIGPVTVEHGRPARCEHCRQSVSVLRAPG